ncbi:MAG: hypothetical protein ABIA37_05430 [Candidatus Woesearchaeota archaeon]
MEDKRQMVCDRCHKSDFISEMRFVSKGDDAKITLCRGCRKEDSSEKKKVEAKKADVSKKNYFCGRCRYKFQFDPTSVTNLKCPYCGKPDKVELHPGKF